MFFSLLTTDLFRTLGLSRVSLYCSMSILLTYSKILQLFLFLLIFCQLLFSNCKSSVSFVTVALQTGTPVKYRNTTKPADAWTTWTDCTKLQSVWCTWVQLTIYDDIKLCEFWRCRELIYKKQTGKPVLEHKKMWKTWHPPLWIFKLQKACIPKKWKGSAVM